MTYTALTAAPRRLYVLTGSGDIHRVTAFAVTAHGDIEPVVTAPTAYPVRHPAHMGSWLSCRIARVRGAHRPKPEQETEHLDEVTDARGPVPAAIGTRSVVPYHRRPKTDTGKDT